MATEIVKVQVPLSEPVKVGGRCLIYDKERKHMVEAPLRRTVLDALKGDVKGYFKASWSSGAAWWTIKERVQNQDW